MKLDRVFSIILPIMLTIAARLMANPGDVIPRPVDVREMPGQFTLTPTTAIVFDEDSPEVKATAQVLADLLSRPLAEHPVPGSILLTRKNADPTLGDEGYELTVLPEGVVIRASTTTGLFYGIQSLRQLLPPEVESKEKVAGVNWAISAVVIKDSPRYAWRGLMLDVSRHFFDKAEVKHVLDLMALHKLNHFHWHLTDDQGWRIEIKKYPLLTEIGAWRDGIGFNLDPKRSTHYRADGKYGGFYTQDDIREVVAYAASLHITVIPEIEMPGHSMAALAAYPQFSCEKKAHDVGTKAGVMDAIYDPGNEETFTFLGDVLGEVVSLFPAPYVHIGGDEVPKEPWKKTADCQALIKAKGLKDENELQSYFIKRIEKILQARHRQLIGWDEILEGGLAPGATVMSWRGVSGGITAAREGHDVVMTPTSHAYFDYSQTKAKQKFGTIGGYLTLKTVYSYDPTPEVLTPDQQKHILGSQGNLWTEYMPNIQQVEYQAFPRACAMAEVAWSPRSRIDFADFRRRLDGLEKRFAIMGVNYFHEGLAGPEPIGEWHPKQMSQTPHPLDWDITKSITQPGKYQVTMQYTGGACRLDISWVAMQADGTEIARDTHDGRTGAADRDNVYTLNIVAVKPGTKFTLIAQTRSDGGTDSNGTVTVERVP